MSERKPFPYLHTRTGEFLVAAYQSGAYDTLLEEASANPNIAKRINVLTYYSTFDGSLEDIGAMMKPPVTGEAVRRSMKGTLIMLWERSSEKVQRQFSPDSIPLRKPLGPTSRLRISLGNGGKSAEAAAMILEGRSPKEIKDALDLHQDFSHVRRVVGNLGVEMGPLPNTPSSSEEIEERARVLSDPDVPIETFIKVLGVLAKSHSKTKHMANLGAMLSIRDFCQIAEVYTSPKHYDLLRSVLKEGGAHLVSHIHTVEEGKNAGKVQRYDYLASRELDSSVEFAQTHPTLAPYRHSPIGIVAGPMVEDLPTTTAYYRGGDFVNINEATKPLGLDLEHDRRMSVTQFLRSPDCDVSVYNAVRATKKNYRVRSEDLPRFREFARRRIAELGF